MAYTICLQRIKGGDGEREYVVLHVDGTVHVQGQMLDLTKLRPLLRGKGFVIVSCHFHNTQKYEISSR